MGGKSQTTVSTVEKYDAFDVQSSAYGIAVPIVYGTTKIAGNLLWYGNFQSHEHRDVQKNSGGGKGGGKSKSVSISYTYTVSCALGLCEGPIRGIGRLWKGNAVYNSAADVSIGLFPGELGQDIWETIRTVKPAEAVPYSGIAFAAATDYDLGDSISMENHQFEVKGFFSTASQQDANPADILFDVLTSTRYGAAFPASRLDFAAWRLYCEASGIRMSVALDTQQQAADIVSQMMTLTNSEIVWDGERLTAVPRTEETIIGNGVQYVPDSRPIYDLNDDHFLPKTDGVAVEVSIKSQADAKNSVSLDYRNRESDYASEVASAVDQADIDTSEERAAEKTDAAWICDGTVARRVAQVLLQRSLYVRRSFRFRLPWTFALLSPMDIVTLTDEALGLDREPVRITQLEESDDGCLDVQADELLYGVATAPAFELQTGSGFTQDTNVDPGDVARPIFFETPVTSSDTGLEIAVAVTGQTDAWGGCTVWYSPDGNGYRRLGRVLFGALMGEVIADTGDTIDVSLLRGSLPDASPQDAQALTVVGYIGGTPEYIGIGGVQLTGERRYRLSGLARGALRTAQAAHTSGDAFVLYETGQLARTGALDLDLIGKTVFFKFTSFNVYESSEQSLADVQAFPCTIDGRLIKMPPQTPVTGVRASVEGYGVLLQWDSHPEPDVTGYRVTDPESGEVLGDVDANFARLSMTTAGHHAFAVAPVDRYGNSGPLAVAEVGVDAPAVTTLTGEIVKGQLSLSWQSVATSFSLDHYLIEHSATETGKRTTVGIAYLTTFAIDVVFSGSRWYHVTPVDVYGNAGSTRSVQVSIEPPGAVRDWYTQVVEANVMHYWRDPATGSLPIADYIMRRGASWEAGESVGTNGPSTFTALFESDSGEKRYWLAAIDTAGNVGPATSLDVTVSAPAGYVLHSDLALNMAEGEGYLSVADAGVLTMPVSPDETFESHFIGRAWPTPQAQIDAGFPVYIQPGTGGTGWHEWVIDYGQRLEATTVTVKPEVLNKIGDVSLSVQIWHRADESDPWIPAAAGARTAFIVGVQYVRVRVTVTSPAVGSIVSLSGVQVTLSVTEHTDFGSATVSASDPTGTFIPFSTAFADVESINVTPKGAAYAVPVVNFEDIPHPDGFRVKLFNQSGARIDGAVAWTASGY